MSPNEPQNGQIGATTLVCTECPWTHQVAHPEDPDKTLLYHRVQVHNDQDAVKRLVRF